MIVHMTTTNDKMGSPFFTLCLLTLYFQFEIPKRYRIDTVTASVSFIHRMKIGSLKYD